MTVFHRAHKHLQTISESRCLRGAVEGEGASCKRHVVPRRKHRWLLDKEAREELEGWLLMATCCMILFVCTVWFLGKVTIVLSWLVLLALDSISGSWSATLLFHAAASRHHLKKMPWNYQIPHAHDLVGDRSRRYSLLREEIDATFPEDGPRSLQRAADLKKHVDLSVMPTVSLDHSIGQLPSLVYDIYDCPPTPPAGYPFQWNLMKVVKNWNPENTTVPSTIFNGLCVFDFANDYHTAMTYRNAELPFVMTKDPTIAATVERWNSPGYMERLLGRVPHRTTRSDTNHFLYAVAPPTKEHVRKGHKQRKTAPPNWKDPTSATRMSYSDWLEKANVTDDKCTPDQPHWYYRLIGCGLTGPDGSCDKGSSEYLYDELPFFQPSPGGLYLRDAEQQKGIHCRFGQKGIVADNHFDAGRNTIVVLGGSRRYMLASPDQCLNMALFEKKHPSARHSEVNWSSPDLERFPQFGQAMGNEVVLQAGDALYLPNNWFHHIISLDLNFQCNTRSGFGDEYREEMKDCGFNTH